MAHAYTPGLKVSSKTIFRKERRLPLKGDVLVSVGDVVRAEDVIARTELPGNVQTMNVANKLSVLPEDIERHMTVEVGGWADKGKIIAETRTFFGLFKSQCRMPVGGTIESVSAITGQVIIREKAIPVEVNAFVDGKVVEVFEGEGVLVETDAAFVQGIFGVGGEVHGPLHVVAGRPDEVLRPEQITPDMKDKILLGGSLITIDVFDRAREMGVKGIVAGGIGDADLRNLLGYDLGVAITGSEDIGLTLVVTEGFGQMTMADKTFDLLKSKNGVKTSMSGATQIRAGVIRPEIVIPMEDRAGTIEDVTESSSGLTIGTPVRVIREPYFGAIGTVTALPPELQVLKSEARVRVLEVEFGDGSRSIIPRANVELIED
ncbi:MAG: hypothetical protein PVJ42_03860 [bacterium]